MFLDLRPSYLKEHLLPCVPTWTIRSSKLGTFIKGDEVGLSKEGDFSLVLSYFWTFLPRVALAPTLALFYYQMKTIPGFLIDFYLIIILSF